MPLFKFDVLEGRTDEQLRQLLDVTHVAMVEALGVPELDRYQVVNQHKPAEMVIHDTGLGFTRSKSFVLITIISNKRTPEKKQKLYQLVTERLEAECGISKDDVMFSLVENTDVDWSFGHGEAQFITGKL